MIEHKKKLKAAMNTIRSHEAVRLGVMPPLTGLVEIYGPEISWAAKIAAQEINESGGVLGRPLELIIEDDGSLPDTAVSAAEKLIDQHGCVALVGNLLSNSRIAVAYRVAEPRKIPYLNFSFYEGSILSRYFFHFAALPNQQIEKMIPFMQSKYGPRMFFAGNNYEWPLGSIDAAKRVLTRAGGEIVGEEYFPIGVTTGKINELLARVATSGADVFVPYFAGADQVTLLTNFSEMGLKKKMAVVMGHYDEMMASQLPPEVREGFYSSNTYFMTIDSPENRRYLERLAAMPGVTGIWPQGNGILTNFGEGTYLCVKAFALAANKAQSLEPEALVDSLENLSLVGPQGSVQMDPVTHHAKVNTYLSRCDVNGSFAIVENFGALDPVMPERYGHIRIDARAAREEDIRLQARILEHMTEGVCLVRLSDGVIVYTNSGFRKMFGYEGDDLLGKPIAETYATTDVPADEIAKEINTLLYRKGSWEGEVKNIKKDGTQFWCSVSVSTLTHAEHGEVWLAVHQDISARKLAEEALRQKDRAIEESPVGVIITDINGMIEYANPALLKMHGYAAIDELLGRTPETFISGQTSQEITQAMWAHLRAGKAWSGELLTQRTDGSQVWINLHQAPIRMDDGSVDHYLFIMEDISELHEYRTNLEETVRKRTEQLELAKEKAEVASEAKANFLASMSHEIRTPMNAIIGFSDLALRSSELAGAVRSYIDKANISAKNLLVIINEILDFSKLEANKVDLEIICFNLLQTIEDSIQMLAPEADKKNLSLEFHYADSLDKCFRGDMNRLRQVVLNLVGNAIKFTEKGSVKLTVEKDGEMVLFKVIDTGIGMSPEQIGHVFESFRQADQSTSRRFGGSGLGTTISKKIVEVMGGKIWCESEVAQGSTFQFALPLPHKDCKPGCEIKEHIEASIALSPRLFRILLAEDDFLNGELIRLNLAEKHGHDLVWVKDGAEAVEAFRQGGYDLILMDFQMPVLDGIAATRQIRALEATTGGAIPIIALTASTTMEEQANFRDANMDAFVKKPVDFNELIAIMESVVPLGRGIAKSTETLRAKEKETGCMTLSPVAGVADIVEGLKNWKSPIAYAVALRRFNQERKDDPEHIARLVAAGDLLAAQKITHTLKGLPLGLRMITESAKRLDTALKSADAGQAGTLLPALKDSFDAAVAAIANLKFPEESSLPKKAFDREKIGALFRELLVALDADNPDFVEPLVMELKMYLDDRELAEISRDLELFDFTSAKQSVLDVARKLEV